MVKSMVFSLEYHWHNIETILKSVVISMKNTVIPLIPETFSMGYWSSQEDHPNIAEKLLSGTSRTNLNNNHLSVGPLSGNMQEMNSEPFNVDSEYQVILYLFSNDSLLIILGKLLLMH